MNDELHTIQAIWQEAPHEVSLAEAHEIRENVVGFFQLLASWQDSAPRPTTQA